VLIEGLSKPKREKIPDEDVTSDTGNTVD